MIKLSLVVATAVFGCGLAAAQAPANAPAGSNGICKDGTYSTAASKSGACQGHKGVQTWYAATPAKTTAATAAKTTATAPAKPMATPAPMTAAKPAQTMPAPAASQSMPSKPTPAPAVAAAAAPKPGTKLSPAQAAAAKTAQPGGKPGLVWVNTSSNVYHCYGDTYYGKTAQGSYMSEADAKAKGAHGDHGKSCAGK